MTSPRAAGNGELVLVIDDDPDIRSFVALSLELEGYRVVLGSDGSEAVPLAIEHKPCIILMDVMMPGMTGLEALDQLRDDARTNHVPVIMLTARAQVIDKVEGLTAGADDYVTKPFEPRELLARIRVTQRRAREMRSVSTLTGLPGNPRIEQEIVRRIAQRAPFALLYVDLNLFKGYNDHYGFLRGDEVLTTLARIATATAGEVGDGSTFVGHVGGDDFVLLARHAQYAEVADTLCRRFDDVVPSFYDRDDLDHGSIRTRDRQGREVELPLMSLSIGIAHDAERAFAHQGEPVAIATEMKSFAKKTNRNASNWEVDRRHAEATTGGGHGVLVTRSVAREPGGAHDATAGSGEQHDAAA